MAAPKGNQFWKLRSKHGRDKLFKTPKLLIEAAYEYFEWCDDNPWVSSKSGNTPKGPTSEEKPTQRPYTLGGLVGYLGANKDFWAQFKASNPKGFSIVIKEIENIIETQQFEGAIVGAFNPNIIARKLGLSDSTKVDVTSGGDKIIPVRKLSNEELLKRLIDESHEKRD